MECSLNTFDYRPLDRSRREIRLVLLSPASDFQADIYCDLQYASLDDHPSYEALSYAWGDAVITSPIFLQAQSFLVTTNLLSALRHLRLRDCDRALWIDAISINQTDLNERQQQVALMGDVYKCAQRDLLWLGPELEPIDSVMHIFEFQYSDSNSSSLVEFQDLLKNKSVIPWRPLLVVFGSSVWKRLWIVQELALANDVHVIYGSKKLPWKPFCSLANILLSSNFFVLIRTLKDVSWDGLASASAIYDSWHLPSRRGDVKRPQLLQMWQEFKALDCIDLRDKIYAMLNIVEADLGVQPDYSISAPELFRLVARVCIIRHQNLKVLDYATFMEYSRWLRDQKEEESATEPLLSQRALDKFQSRYTLPSWVPDFGCREPFSNPLWLQTPAGVSRWPKIPWSDKSSNDLENPADPTQISLSGLPIDTIADLSKTVAESRQINGIVAVQHYMHYYSERRTTKTWASTYFNGQIYDEAYWRTISCDVYHEDDDYVLLRLHLEHMRSSWQKGFEAIIEACSDARPSGEFAQFVANNVELRRFADHIIHMTWRYSFCTTTKGYMALVPESTKPGDIICCLYGGEIPHVLRPLSDRPEEDLMTLVGPAYLHGFMDGLPITLRDEGTYIERKFVLT